MAKPDVVVVSTRPDHILRIAVLVAGARCDLVCEKPLGLSLDETAAVHDAVTRSLCRFIARF